MDLLEELHLDELICGAKSVQMQAVLVIYLANDMDCRHALCRELVVALKTYTRSTCVMTGCSRVAGSPVLAESHRS